MGDCWTDANDLPTGCDLPGLPFAIVSAPLASLASGVLAWPFSSLFLAVATWVFLAFFAGFEIVLLFVALAHVLPHLVQS